MVTHEEQEEPPTANEVEAVILEVLPSCNGTTDTVDPIQAALPGFR
jgi:hypothetical protein